MEVGGGVDPIDTSVYLSEGCQYIVLTRIR